MSFEHRAHKRKKPSSTARHSSEDRLERDDCSSKRVRRQRRGSVSSEASDCSVDSALGSDCSVDSALGSDCSVDSALGSDYSVDSALGSDCSVDSALGSDCSVGSALGSDCSVGSALGSDCSVGSALGSDCSADSALGSECSAGSPAESVNSLEGALETDCSVDSPVASDCSGHSKLASDCSVDRPMETTSRCSVGSPETTRCSVGSPEASDCPVDSPSIYSVRRVSPQKPQRSQTLGSPLAPVNSATSDCSVDWILSFTSGRSRVNASENITTEVEMEVLEKTSLKTFLISSHRRAAAAGSEAVHAFSQLATYVRNFIKEYPEDLERISKDDLNNLNEKDSFTASLLPPSAPARVISMDSPMASVSSVASDCSEDRFINFSSGNPQSSQPCSSPARVISMDSPMASVSSVASDCSEDRFLNFSSGNPQSSQPCSSPARVISMDSPMASVSSVASDCSEDRFLNFSSGNPQSSQPCRAAAGSDAPPVSLHDSGSSWLDIMTFTDEHLEEINDLQSSPNTTSWSAPTPVYFQDSGIEMDETVSFHDEIERIIRLLDVTYDDEEKILLEYLFSIIEDYSINLNEKASRTASASPSLPRMAAKEMIIAETASDTLMNSSGKPNTQRKPAQSKTTQRKTPQPNHSSKPDSSVNKENSARPDFYNQGTVSSSAHGSFINNRANYRSSGNHFTSVTAQAAETASHVMFEAVQAAETAASQLMLKGVQTPAEASQLMFEAVQVAAHANKMVMGAPRAAEAAASQLMFREAQRPTETNVMFSEAWKAATASQVICKAAQEAAAASQLMFKAAQRLAEAGVLFREAQREATASLLMVNAARKTAIASQSMFKVALGAAEAACVMFNRAQRPAAAKESYEIYMAVQEEAAISQFILKAAKRAAERLFQRCGSCDRCTQYVRLQPHKKTLH
ncbi:hypothetical protein HHUSO_G33369 [Huso huso]|uniref:Uncharacterized protein n=1 Tax=Huso huso TaxID=61971 RepID=A0ABR0Y7I3_HUSHU